MNSWGNEYGIPNQFGGIPAMAQMMPNMVQSLIPPLCMISDIAPINPTPTMVPQQMEPQPMIGPIHQKNDVQVTEDDETLKRVENSVMTDVELENQSHEQGRKSGKNDRNDRYYDRERPRRRSRSRDHYRFDRRSRDRTSGRSDRSERNRRDRPSKWSNSDSNTLTGQGLSGNIQMMPGMFNMMGQSMDMTNVGSIPGMAMMPGMSNMMDPNLVMMSHPIPNQTIYTSTAVLLPPVAGTSIPKRREKPMGCRTIFVGGLPSGISEDAMVELFQRFGSIQTVKMHKQGMCHVRFDNHMSIEQAFLLSGYRFKLHEQSENEATTLFIDYALNRDDQTEYEKNKHHAPPRIEPFTPTNLTFITERIKNDETFVDAAPTLCGWLKQGECNKKYSNTFYSLIQAANNHVRRLYNDKMQLDDEFNNLKSTMREKYVKLITQYEQVAKILTLAKDQRVSDHFSKQQRRNIEMWLKMTEEVDNIKEEFNMYFDEDETEVRLGKNMTALDKYEELRKENENLMFELEGYKNEAHLAKDEAERKFEKFKAHFIAQQALQNPSQVYPPLPPHPIHTVPEPQSNSSKVCPPPPTPDDIKKMRTGEFSQKEARLVSILTAFLLVHPLGTTQDYLVSYVKNMAPETSQITVNQVLQKYTDIFRRKTTSVGHRIEYLWEFVAFENIKNSI